MTPLLHLFPFSVSLYRQGASSRDWYRRTGWYSVISSTPCIPQDNHRRWHVIETQHFHTQWTAFSSLLPRLYPGSLQSPALPSFLPNKRTLPEIPGLGLNPSPFLTLYTAKLSWPLFWSLPLAFTCHCHCQMAVQLSRPTSLLQVKHSYPGLCDLHPWPHPGVSHIFSWAPDSYITSLISPGKNRSNATVYQTLQESRM